MNNGKENTLTCVPQLPSQHHQSFAQELAAHFCMLNIDFGALIHSLDVSSIRIGKYKVPWNRGIKYLAVFVV